MAQIKCGAAERIITPSIENEYDLPGYYHVRLPEKVLSELLINVVVLDDGADKTVLISIDVCSANLKFAKNVRARLEKDFGIKPERVMVTVTHTHTGSPEPYYRNVLETRTAEQFIELIADAVDESIKKMVPVTVSFAEGEEKTLNFNRVFKMKDGTYRSNPGRAKKDQIECTSGPIDHSVTLLRFADESGKVVAQIVNYANHCDSVGINAYCADWPGEIRRHCKAALGDQLVTLTFIGCCGNVNHFDLFEKYYTSLNYEIIGKKLADDILELHKTAKIYEDPTTDAVNKTFVDRRRQPTDEDIEWAKGIMSSPMSRMIDIFYATERLHLRKYPRLNEIMEVQVIRVGDCVMTTLPCEAWSDIGLDIKKDSPYKDIMVTGMANGHSGYIATEPAFSGGCYEAKLCIYNACMTPVTAQKLVDNSVELLKKIKKNDK